MSTSGLVQSHIEFWLILTALQYQIKRSSIKPSNSSDHSVVTIEIECLNTQKDVKDSGNSKIFYFHNLNFVKLIEETIANF